MVLELDGMQKLCITVLTGVLKISGMHLKVIVHRVLILLCLRTVRTNELSISVLGVFEGHAVRKLGGQGASNLPGGAAPSPSISNKNRSKLKKLSNNFEKLKKEQQHGGRRKTRKLRKNRKATRRTS